MIDLPDWLDAPRGLLLGVLRFLWWLAWDICIETVGWSVGWCVLRTVTLGRSPQDRLGGVDDADSGTAILVEIVGLAVLAMGIWWLAGEWP
ncbi:hypothetical protein [Hydrogenophaga sp. RWCD_12]|uniref:hypothetical protein n=1 Tax=Hydrogenophaga sp. RWCD_12 TaxID=3391190 RepID=UPI00398475B3